MHKDMTLSEADRRPLLSVADALDYAAELINFRRVNQMLMASVGSMVSDIPEAIRGAPQLVQEAMKVAQTQPEKQAEVMYETARLLRELAAEHRVLDMRKATQEPTRG